MSNSYTIMESSPNKFGIALSPVSDYLNNELRQSSTPIWLIKDLPKRNCYKWLRDFEGRKNSSKELFIKRKLNKLIGLKREKEFSKEKNPAKKIALKKKKQSISKILQDKIPKFEVTSKERPTPIGGQPGYKIRYKYK